MVDRLKKYFTVYGSEDTKRIFKKNEIESNRLVAIVMAACGVILIVAWILNMFGVFTLDKHRMNTLAIQGLFELAFPLVLYFIFKGQKSWLKYLMVICLLLVLTRLFSALNHNVILIMTIPVLLSSRYFSRGFTYIISALSIMSLLVGTISAAYFGIVDLNFFPPLAEGTNVVIHGTLRESLLAFGGDPNEILVRSLIHGFLPRLLVFMIITMIAVLIAQHGYNMVIEQERVATASAKVKIELDSANRIQNGVVPNIFPPFPERTEFDIYAAMYTAKEVGGDFYDFFFVDDDHLAIVVADVSDKGVPAALFMMAAKILISDRALMGGTPGEILGFVNNRICTNNKAEMFVTVWLGIIDLKTGKGIAANAGHEYPVFRDRNGEYEVLKDNHSFIVGGMENVRYKDYEFTLKNGDALFLYTDGVPEANNSEHDLFSTERMVDALNKNSSASPEELIGTVKIELDNFVQGYDQSDDITMVSFRYNGYNKD